MMTMTKPKAATLELVEKKKVHGRGAKTPPKTVVTPTRIASVRCEIKKLKKKIVMQKEQVNIMKKDTGKLLDQKKNIAIALAKAERMMKVAHEGYEKAALEHNTAQAARRRCHAATEWNPSSQECWARGVDANKQALQAVQKLNEIMNLVSAVQDEKTCIQAAYDQTTTDWYSKLQEYMRTGAVLEDMLAKRFELRMTLHQLEHPPGRGSSGSSDTVDKENHNHHRHHSHHHHHHHHHHRSHHHGGGGGDRSTGWHLECLNGK
jgi:hypothetical protein